MRHIDPRAEGRKAPRRRLRTIPAGAVPGIEDLLSLPDPPLPKPVTAAICCDADVAHREELQLLVLGAPIPMCLMLGPLHVVELINDGYRQLVAPREVVGEPLREALPELEGQGVFELLDQVRATGQPCAVKEQRLLLLGPSGKADREVFLTFALQPVRDLQGSLDGVMFSGVDVTETIVARRTVAELVRQSQLEAQRKDEFLAMLGHELRNPLAALTTAHQVMAQRAQRDPRAAGLQERCERQVGILVRLVDDLLDISRVTRGKVELHREIVDLAAIIDRAFLATRLQMDARKHETSVTIAPGPFWVDGDPTRLEQVFANLLSNATKYTDPGGQVSIRLSRDDSGVPSAVVRVHDSGRGIDRGQLETVFDLFMQVDGGLDRSAGGLGIGLTLVRQLVAMHGGEVLAESEGLGQGSTFTVRLPLAAAVAEPAPVEAAKLSRPMVAVSRKVVVVEDNRDARECLQVLLQIRGHDVHVASDGVEGRDLILATHPDVAFLDVGLPTLDGFQLAEQLRASPGLTGTRLIALTGYGGPETRMRALAAGFDEHLTKPVTLAQLERVLQTETTPHN
jgi:signal transduction histidine kinase/ActR/RegA family two-component response regulator